MAEEKLEDLQEEKKKKKSKKKKKDEDIEVKEGGKGAVFIATVVIIIIWLAILGLCIKLDVGGFGSGTLYPLLKDVPVINKILPEPKDDIAAVNEDYPYATLKEAVEQIKALELQVQQAQDEKNSATAQIEELQAEISRLKQFETNQTEFQKLKNQFYNEVVYADNAPDITEYKKYYESIDPANAEVLYKQVVGEVKEEEEIENYAKAYSEMKPAQAAKIFEAMTENLDLAAKILKNMDTESRGKILGAMNSDVAARITKIMEP